MRSIHTKSKLVSVVSRWSYVVLILGVRFFETQCRLLYTSLRHSQPTSFMVSHSTSPDHTTLPAQHFRSSGLLCRWSDGLELFPIRATCPKLPQHYVKLLSWWDDNSKITSSEQNQSVRQLYPLAAKLSTTVYSNITVAVLGLSFQIFN